MWITTLFYTAYEGCMKGIWRTNCVATNVVGGRRHRRLGEKRKDQDQSSHDNDDDDGVAEGNGGVIYELIPREVRAVGIIAGRLGEWIVEKVLGEGGASSSTNDATANNPRNADGNSDGNSSVESRNNVNHRCVINCITDLLTLSDLISSGTYLRSCVEPAVVGLVEREEGRAVREEEEGGEGRGKKRIIAREILEGAGEFVKGIHWGRAGEGLGGGGGGCGSAVGTPLSSSSSSSSSSTTTTTLPLLTASLTSLLLSSLLTSPPYLALLSSMRRNVRSIAGMYRLTNRPGPRGPSRWVRGMLGGGKEGGEEEEGEGGGGYGELTNATADDNKPFLPSILSLGVPPPPPLHTPTTPNSSPQQQQQQQRPPHNPEWKLALLRHLATAYGQAVDELVKGAEETARALSSRIVNGGGGAGTADDGSETTTSDTEKVRMQCRMDKEEFGRGVERVVGRGEGMRGILDRVPDV